MEPRLRDALGQMWEIFSELPPEWLYVDGDDSLPVQLDVELDRIEGRLEKEKTSQSIKQAFQELVRPRESALRFGEIRTFMADEPEKAVEELFHRYVKGEDAAGAVSGS